jgi:hypothetical protein
MALDFLKKPFQKIKGSNKAPAGSRSSSFERRSVQAGEKNKANGALVNGNTPHSDGKVKGNSSKKANNRDSSNGHPCSKKIDQSFMEVEPEDGATLYRPLGMNMSKRRGTGERFLFKDLDMQSKCFSRSSFPEVGWLDLPLLFPNRT